MTDFARTAPRWTALLSVAALAACGGTGQPAAPSAPSTPILPALTTQTTIGSTIDPIDGDGNPYGLAIARVTGGKVTAGDLVVCNFNDGATNSQGLGVTIVGLHPVAGSAPYRIATDASLKGCNALDFAPNGDIWTADYSANDNAIFAADGTLRTALTGGAYPWVFPWGEASATHAGATAFYVSNAGSGTIDRVATASSSYTPQSFVEIAKGFAINGGQPGSILAPSGLTYDAPNDILYVIDGVQNTVVALSNVSQIGADGVSVGGSGFTGPSAASARVVASGAPLNGPISSALLPNGNVLVGNTLDPNGTNLLVEISPSRGVVATRNVDKGAAGAIFGIAVGGTAASPKIFVNDDNANTVIELTP